MVYNCRMQTHCVNVRWYLNPCKPKIWYTSSLSSSRWRWQRWSKCFLLQNLQNERPMKALNERERTHVYKKRDRKALNLCGLCVTFYFLTRKLQSNRFWLKLLNIMLYAYIYIAIAFRSSKIADLSIYSKQIGFGFSSIYIVVLNPNRNYFIGEIYKMNTP